MASSPIPIPEDGICLGFDLSTQSLTVAGVNNVGTLVYSASVNFDDDLENHPIPVYRSPPYATMPSALFGEALEVLLDKMYADNFQFQHVYSVSAAAQQHGSVFLTSEFERCLSSLDSSKTLSEQISEESFAFKDGPIWEDSSTHEECKIIEEGLGGIDAMSAFVGARATLRFTGPQILARNRRDPDAFSKVARVALISAYFTSILAGKLVPEDVAEACGTHLFDLRSEPPRWLPAALRLAKADGIMAAAPVHSYTSVGSLSEFFVSKYQFRENIPVICATGDNPASIASLPELLKGDVLGSFGTSDTAQWLVDEEQLETDSQGASLAMSFRSPLTTTPSFVRMLVYSNGSLTREAVRDGIFGSSSSTQESSVRSWADFERLVDSVPPGCSPAKVGCFYYRPEIAPRMPAERSARVVDAKSGEPTTATHQELCRLVLEWRALVFKAHLSALGVDSVGRIIVTGGGAQSKVFPQIIADVIDAPVYRLENTASAALGAARRARVGLFLESGIKSTLAPPEELNSMKLVASPIKKSALMYKDIHFPMHSEAFESSV